MQLTGSQALIRALEMEGVDTIFGLPGGCILPVYDPLLDSPIRHILVRHEQGAGHMAEGYAHVTGRPGRRHGHVGPGRHQHRHARSATPTWTRSRWSSSPGQVPVAAIGTDAFQECDTIGITRSVTKHNELVTSAADIPRAVREAFHIATTGRPGPVLLDIPKDIVDPKNPNSQMEWHWPDDDEVRDGLPGYKPTLAGHPRKIREAAELILRSERPVIYAGGGILKARAAEALRELAELCDIHVVTTLMARGRLPRQPPARPRHAGHARQLHRGHLDAALRPAHRPRQPLRRPGHRQGRRPSRPRRRSSTSTSTPPSSARCAGPTSRSSATAAS